MKQKNFNYYEEHLDNMTPKDKASHLNNYNVISETSKFISKIDSNRKNSMLPTPIKKGQIMKCRLCGKEMRREDFNKDMKIALREFKWQQHQQCMEQHFDLADAMTPGLLDERT